VTDMLQNLAQVALGTGLPASGIAAVLAGSPDLAANIGVKDAGAAAAIYKGIYGDNTQATSMAQVANLHGTGAYAVAGLLGMDVTQLDRLRGTTAGQGQIADALDARARAMATANGPEAGFSAFNAMLTNAGGSALSWDAFQRAIQAAPNAGALAAAAPLPPVLAGPPAPGSAQAGLANVAAGNLAAGATASQPWNVKDMTVNAAQVVLAGAGNQITDTGAVFSGHASAAQLASIAQQGGVAGNAALLSQAVSGVPGALVHLAGNIAGGLLDVVDPSGVLKGGAGAVASTVEHHLTLDVTIKQNGQVVGTKQVTAPLPNSGQSYGQYTPQRQGGPR